MSVTKKILESLGTVILDKDAQLHLALSCILAGGHLLIEDLPGMGKTTLARAMAQVLGLSWQRVQFTSDMLPGDLIGSNIYNEENRTFEFHEGPVFTHMLLADEINRGSPRTQSALLEVMAEHQVSFDRETRKIQEPFFVIATQNPLDQAGTFPLPESQLDRFMLRIELGFPARAQELRILRNENISTPLPALTNADDIIEMQKETESVHIADPVYEYIMDLCQATRTDPAIPNPLSPRAAISLTKASQAYAYTSGRDYVTPDDVQTVFPGIAEHRLRKGTQAALNSSPISMHVLEKVTPVA